MPEVFGQRFLPPPFCCPSQEGYIELMQFLQNEIPEVNYSQARVAILPVPFEKTTSFGKGAAHGPQAVLEVSPFLETYDEELEVEPFNAGITTLPTLNFSGSIEADFQIITNQVNQLLDDEKFVIAIGGEHSISFPLYRAYHAKFKNLSVIQFDAHADLRDQYQGTPFSHACVMRRIFSLNQRIVQLGIRALSKEEAKFIKSSSIKTWFAHQLYKGWSEKILHSLTENVYLTFDVDFFDPAVLPATGTPEPGGFFWPETLKFLKKLFETKNVIGVDVVELSPQPGSRHSEFTVAKLIYKLIGYKFFLNR